MLYILEQNLKAILTKLIGIDRAKFLGFLRKFKHITHSPHDLLMYSVLAFGLRDDFSVSIHIALHHVDVRLKILRQQTLIFVQSIDQ